LLNLSISLRENEVYLNPCFQTKVQFNVKLLQAAACCLYLSNCALVVVHFSSARAQKNPSQALLTADAVRLRGIGLFVCLSHHSTAAAACGGFAAERRAGMEISIDSGGRPAATAPQHGAQQKNAGSAKLTAELTRLNTDLY